MSLAEQELHSLLRDLESDRVERKESASDRDKLSQAVCAFANDMPGHGLPGVLFVGVTDDGRVTSDSVSDKLLLILADLRDQGTILPPPTMTVRKIPVDGAEVAVVEVQPAMAPPVRYKGRVYILVGPRRATANADEERHACRGDHQEATVSAPIVTFFNNKGGVGKTTLVYHLAWMLADLGHRVVAADLDPQANLTAAFLDEEEIEQLWSGSAGQTRTIWSAIRPFVDDEGSIEVITPTSTADDNLVLLPSELTLSRFEDDLSTQWRDCLEGTRLRPFLVMSAFWTVLRTAAEAHEAEIVLVDVGPSLGAINRAALVASDHVVVPMAPDLFSLQGLRNLGPTLRDWRQGWRKRLDERPADDRELPIGAMLPVGYVLLAHGVRLNRPVQAYQRWMDQIPVQFHQLVLDQTTSAPLPDNDQYCLAQLKHYHSLMPMAQDARKPVFFLKPADGAFGGHAQAAQRAYGDFRELASRLLDAALPPPA